MNKIVLSSLLLLFLFGACQRELFFPPDYKPDVVPEKTVRAIVITDSLQSDYDSVVFRFNAVDSREIHYSRYGDSATRIYTYDQANRLITVSDDQAIYYTNTDKAVRIRFFYGSSGELMQMTTDFTGVNNIPATIHTATSNSESVVQIYDTSYHTNGVDLGWANRTIYNKLDNKNNLLYDSCIYFNTASGLSSSVVKSYVYAGDSNAISISRNVYQQDLLSEWGITKITRDQNSPVAMSLRKKLFHNLSGWFQQGIVWQDDRYPLFDIPWQTVKLTDYTGSSLNGTADPLQVRRKTEYKNSYLNNELSNSVSTYSVTGQGSTRYVHILTYYYQ